ncbi:hypothetical protein [Prauserella endophytica]|uniref:Tissue inhibitor of metalloproteinase n=1 Tax=Prauserella endophytica TaxID=1592324 RepID=A0ABY2S2S2_9PSEU|nr:hypothetical protein [Prauserella endophytica]TKG69742.1 hypothetical protein FCN18_19890 [Prauserella endophytica]
MIRRTGRTVLLVLAVLALVPVALVLPAPPAHACSCAESTDAERFARADAVFTGTVTGREQGTPENIHVDTAIFEVTRVYKGRVRARQEVESPGSASSCHLSLGGTLLVFAHRTRESGARLSTALCDGTRPIGPAESLPFGEGRTPLPGVDVRLGEPGAAAPLLWGGVALAAVVLGGAGWLVARRRHSS